MIPIYVDLDGSLIKSDSLHESLLELIRRKPLFLIFLPIWLISGRAAFKAKLASYTTLHAETLPYNQALLDWLETKKEIGHKLYLATAANEKIAKSVCSHLNIFDGYFASTMKINLKGITKQKTILSHSKDFGYVGDSRADLPIWKSAKLAVFAGNNQSVYRKVSKLHEKVLSFSSKAHAVKNLLRLLRPHQWSKNLLVFIPLILAHKVVSITIITEAFIAFICICLAASSAYILNDLLDMQADRENSHKKSRPLAEGSVSIPIAVVTSIALLVSSLTLSSIAAPATTFLLILYFCITCAYSIFFKTCALVDVILLAALYTWRILLGGAVSNIALSHWLLMFSCFFFLSLALAKRLSELSHENKDLFSSNRRGYQSSDIPLINSMGIATGIGSLIIFILYMYSPDIRILYSKSEVLWAVILLMTYWIGRIWLLAGRGVMSQDPVEFALRDKASYITGFLILLTGLVASGRIPFTWI